MRRLFTLLLICPIVAAAAEPPFAPVPNVVDYVATMVGDRGGTGTVTHHAGWTRVDLTEKERVSTSYFSPAGPTAITVVRQPSGAYSYLHIHRGPAPPSGMVRDNDSFRTGERRAFLSESCEVWNVSRSRERVERGFSLTKFSCVTDDGIELWRKSVSRHGTISSTEATRIERRVVEPGQVHPPADLLDLRSWVSSVDGADTAASPDAAQSDMEVVLAETPATPGGRGLIGKTIRRHQSWTYTEERFGDGRRTTYINNAATRLNIRFETDAAGQLSTLVIHKPPPRTDEGTAAQAFGPKELDRRETVLGEECTWFNMTPGMADAGHIQCQTRDGIVLKETHYSRGGGVNLEAVTLQRRVIAPAAFMPPREILTRETWGMPE